MSTCKSWKWKNVKVVIFIPTRSGPNRGKSIQQRLRLGKNLKNCEADTAVETCSRLHLQWFSQLDGIHQQKDAKYYSWKCFDIKVILVGKAISCEFAFYYFFTHPWTPIIFGKNIIIAAVLRIRDPVPFWPLDPGSGMGEKSESRSGMNNLDQIS